MYPNLFQPLSLHLQNGGGTAPSLRVTIGELTEITQGKSLTQGLALTYRPTTELPSQLPS